MRRIQAWFLLLMLSVSGSAAELDVTASAAVAFPGEDSAWMIEGSADVQDALLTWKVRDGKTVIAQQEKKLPRGAFRHRVPLTGAKCGFFSIEVGLEGLSAESSVAVVPEPYRYGVDAPDSFFGLAGGERNAAMVARLGGKRTRLWSAPAWQSFAQDGQMTFRGLDRQVEQARKNHLAVTIVATAGEAAQMPSWSHWKSTRDLAAPENLKYWEMYIAGLARHYRGQVDSIEIQNEPDISFWHRTAIPLHEAAENYAAILRASRRAIRKEAPEMEVFGLDVSGRDLSTEKSDPAGKPGNFAFTRAVLELAPEAADVLTAHPYSHYRSVSAAGGFAYPEDYNMRGLMEQLQHLAKRYGHSGRLAPTEIGWKVARPELPVWDEQYFRHAAVTARALILLKTVPAVEHVIWFHLHAHHGGRESGSYNLAKCRNPLGVNYDKCDFDHLYPVPAASAYAVCARMLESSEFLGKANADSRLSTWLFRRRYDGKTVAAFWSPDNAELFIRLPAGAEAVSAFGRRIEPGPDGRIAVDEFPVYLCGDESVRTMLANAEVTYRQTIVPRKVAVTGKNSKIWLLTNRSGKTVTAELRSQGKSSPCRLTPGVNRIELTSQSPSVLYLPEEGRSIAAEIEPPNYDPVPRVGDLAELAERLNRPEAIRLDSNERLTPPDAPWNGVGDFSIKAAPGWTDDCLLLCVSVRDDKMAGGDALLVAVNAKRDSYDESSGGDHSFYYRPGCAAEQGKCRISRRGTETLYEIEIPWKALGLEKAEAGRVIDFNFAVFDDDGNGVKAKMAWSDGLGDRTIPGLFRHLILKGAE